MEKATLAELLAVQSVLTVVPMCVESAKHPHCTPAPAVATGQSPRVRDPSISPEQQSTARR